MAPARRRKLLAKNNPLLTAAATAARWLPAPVKRLFYRIGPLARLLRGALNRAAPTGPTLVTIAGGALKGCQMLLDLQSEKDYWLGTYETDLQAVIQRFVKPGMTAYDVGANIGYISLLLARAVGADGSVFSFEALPVNYRRLQSNLTLNNLHTRINALPAAVCDSTRMLDFFVHPSTSMGKAAGSAGRAEAYLDSIQVQGISLDDFIYQQGNPEPDVVKMDIEGGEALAVPGMKTLLARHAPILMIELHGDEAADVVYPLLAKNGYDLRLMAPGYPAVKSRQDLGWKSYLLALPKI